MSLIEGPLNEMPARKPGQVVVAVGKQGLRLLGETPRLTWGERAFGGYKNFYLVDTSPQQIDFVLRLSSSVQTLMFDASVTVTASVVDPITIISRGIHDPLPAVKTAATNILADTTRKFGVGQAWDAESLCKENLAKIHVKAFSEGSKEVIRIDEVAIQLKPDAQAEKYLREVHESQLRNAALQTQAEYDRQKATIASETLNDASALLAQYLATKDPAILQILQFQVDQKNVDKGRLIDILKIAIENKHIEPHDLEKIFPNLGQALAPLLPTILTNEMSNLRQIESQSMKDKS